MDAYRVLKGGLMNCPLKCVAVIIFNNNFILVLCHLRQNTWCAQCYSGCHHSHVSLHHPVGVVCSLREALQVWKHLAGNTEHTQLGQVSVGQNVLLLLQTLLTQLHHLREDRQKDLLDRRKWSTYSERWCCVPCCNPARPGRFQSSPDTLHWRQSLLSPCQQMAERETQR